MRKSFTEHLVHANSFHEHGFHSWVFHPGMRFGAVTTWWGAESARSMPHEGVDLYHYIDTAKNCRYLLPGTLIPPLVAGTVVSIFPDFLGQSLLVAHDQIQGGWRLHSIIAHVQIEKGVAVGCRYPDGTIIARLPPSPRPGVPAHIHLTALTIFGPPPSSISWDGIVNYDHIRLVDPVLYLRNSCLDAPSLSV